MAVSGMMYNNDWLIEIERKEEIEAKFAKKRKNSMKNFGLKLNEQKPK